MIKKILIYPIILIILLFLFKESVMAQQYYNFMIPGKDCGVAGDIRTSKCCAPSKLSFVQPPDFGVGFNLIRDIIIGPGMAVLKSFTQPLVDLYAKSYPACLSGKQSEPDPENINCRCELDTSLTPAPLDQLNVFCEKLNKNEVTSCKNCINKGAVWTSLGCIQGSVDKFIGETIFGLGIGLAGGLALLCIIYAAFMMQSSQGNPEKLKKAQELITSCIMGLMLIIFSVFILRLIGVNILQIPGFK